ncbi:MAG: RsmE family RNA methyltransferase [bacterium]
MNDIHKHIFALYAPGLSAGCDAFEIGAPFEYKNELMWQRIVRILRLRAGETVTLFDNTCSINVIISDRTFLDKKQISISGVLTAYSRNHILFPEIIFYPCITKRDTFETIVYAAAQMGASKIVPVISEKVQRELAGPKELDRIQKIMIAACEQARQFVIPEFCEPIKLAQVAHHEFIEGESFGDAKILHKICFECDGASIRELAQKLSSITSDNSLNAQVAGAREIQSIKICVVQGPEGGLTDKEVSFLRSQKFDIYALTPTILRSQDAVLVGLGFLRSFI